MIDKIYINEAIKIRKEYLENLLNVDKFQVIYEQLLEKLEQEEKRLSNFNKETTTQEDLFKYVKEIEIEINLILDNIKPYINKIKDLDNDQKILYDNIKEKYVNITDEEIYSQIIPIIEEVDNNFNI